MRLPIKLWTLRNSDAPLIYGVLISFLVGVLLFSLFELSVFLSGVIVVVSLALMALVVLRLCDVRVIFVAIALAAFALGGVRVLLVPNVSMPLAPYVGSSVTLMGEVALDPEGREKNTHVVVAVERAGEAPASGRVLLFAERGPDLSYGDRVLVRGELVQPEPFETETGAVFDYEGYLAAKGIGAVVFRPNIEVVDRAACCSLLGTLYAGKHALVRSIESVFPEPQGGLLRGMLLGQQDALPEQLTEAFRRSSLVHIVVLSGYNLTVVAATIMTILSLFGLPLRARLTFGAISIVLFALMVGGGATVVRASAMALIALLAQAIRRPRAMVRALFVACVLMVLYNPLILLHDPSFVLSFLATFGLITLSPMVAQLLVFVRVAWIREILAATIATQVFILPALIFYTGSLSLVALPANLLALPLVPFSMLLGLIAGGIGLLSSTVAFVFMIPAWALLSAVLFIAQVSAGVPFAVLDVSYLQTPLIFALYAVLVPLSFWALRAGNKTP